MPYALAFHTGDTLIAGLADGSVFTSPGRGDSWAPVTLTRDPPDRILALCTA